MADTTMNDPTTSTSDQGSLDNASRFRQMSVVLSTFPWATDFLANDITGILTDETFSTYIYSLVRLETNVDSLQSDDPEAGRLQVALYRVAPRCDEFPPPMNLKRAHSIRLCEMICAYRFVDVLYNLQEQDEPSFERPVYPKFCLSPYLPTQFWPLDDWVILLNKARGSVESLDSFNRPQHLTGTSDIIVVPPTAQSMPMTKKLLLDLYGLMKNKKALKILENVQIAALHVACMIQGTASENRLAIPNIPAELEDWHIGMLSEDEAQFFQQFIRSAEIPKIRHPLYGALLYSPLYLLADRKLTGNSWDQERMMKLSKALGNDKPAILVKVENLLWECILDIATGKVVCYEALRRFFTRVDWDSIVMVSERDRTHFADDKLLPKAGGSLTSFDGETDLPESWPLAHLRKPKSDLSPPSDDEPMGIDADRHNITPAPADSVPTGKEDVPVGEVGTGDEPPALTSTPAHQGNVNPSSSDADDEDPPSKKDDHDHARRSDRLKALAVDKPSQATLGGTTSVVRRRRRGAGSKAATPRKKIVPYQQVEKGVFIQQVSIKIIKKPKVTFKPNTERERISGQDIELFDVSGRTRRWTPEFHFKSDLRHFQNFYKLVVQDYINKKPRYLSDPNSSCIKVIEYSAYKAMSARMVQDVLREKHIVITGYPIELLAPTDTVEFDEAGLQLLKNLEANIQFQGKYFSDNKWPFLTPPISDQSIPVDNDYSVQLCTGTLEHVLASAENGGAIINALSFPLPLSEIRKSTFGSDVESWLVTDGLPYCDQDALYPTADMRWGLAATKGARHWIHVDSDGLGTNVDLLCGGRLWLLFRPGENFDLSNFGDIDHFFYEFDVTRPPAHWAVEAVYLQPGIRLLMKPNTPHAVFTTDHSIAVGGHFYSFSNIQQTFFGLVHAFVMDNLVTNTEHPKTRVLLLRMLQYVYKFYVEGADSKRNAASHLPPLGEDMTTFIDLLTLCNFCILSNFLDPRTYNFPDLKYGHPALPTHLLQRQKYDYNALSPDDRHYYSYVRGLAVNLIHWVHCHFVFYDEKNRLNDFTSMARQYLHRQVRTIILYKHNAEQGHYRGVPNCTEEALRCQATLLFSPHFAGEFQGFSLSLVEDEETLSWEGEYTPERRAKPLDFEERDPLKTGTTSGDKMFDAGSATGFPLSNESDDEDTEMDIVTKDVSKDGSGSGGNDSVMQDAVAVQKV